MEAAVGVGVGVGLLQKVTAARAREVVAMMVKKPPKVEQSLQTI